MDRREQAASLRAAGKTLKEIGSELGVSRERARQLLLPRKVGRPRLGPREPLPDLTGRQFGEWVAISRVGGDRDIYACRCSCGREGRVPAEKLAHGRSAKCRGCARVMAHKVCEQCGLEFRGASNQKTCSAECSDARKADRAATLRAAKVSYDAEAGVLRIGGRIAMPGDVIAVLRRAKLI